MATINLQQSEITALVCALELARDEYTSFAEQAGKDALSIAEQFKRQAAQCSALIDRLESL